MSDVRDTNDESNQRHVTAVLDALHVAYVKQRSLYTASAADRKQTCHADDNNRHDGEIKIV